MYVYIKRGFSDSFSSRCKFYRHQVMTVDTPLPKKCYEANVNAVADYVLQSRNEMLLIIVAEDFPGFCNEKINVKMNYKRNKPTTKQTTGV